MLETYSFRQWYIPDRMMGGIQRYLEHGVPPGDFLQAVIKNDFYGLCGRADDENLANLPAYAAYFYVNAPRGSYGSDEAYTAWLLKFETMKDKEENLDE